MLSVVALLGTGLLAGILGALLGLGGGIFLVPALVLVFHLPARVEVGTSLVGVMATSAGVAVRSRPGQGADTSLALRLEIATTVGAIGGGLLGGLMSSQFLTELFALVVFLTAVYLVYKARRKPENGAAEELFTRQYHPHNWIPALSIAAIAGIVSGLLGVGGGFIKVPVMYAIMGVPLGIATATSNFMVGITAAASFFVYYGRGDVHPLVAVPTALGVFMGALAGAWLLPRLRVKWLRWALVCLLLLMGVQMLLRGSGA